MIREWIIFAICLGIGGHVALGVVLHTPDLWPWSQAGLYGLLTGLAVYLGVQIARVTWTMLRLRNRSDKDSSPTSW